MSKLKSQQYIIECLGKNSVEMESSYGKVFYNYRYRNESQEIYQMRCVNLVELYAYVLLISINLCSIDSMVFVNAL